MAARGRDLDKVASGLDWGADGTDRSRKECESRVDAALEPRDAGNEVTLLTQPPMISKSRAGVGEDDVAGNAPKCPFSAELVFQNDACARAVAEQVIVFVRTQEAKG